MTQTLSKSYRLLDTDRTKEQDAREMFQLVIPHIMKNYPIEFNLDLQNLHINGHRNYNKGGSYLGRAAFGKEKIRYIDISWKEYPFPAENHKEFSPFIWFDHMNPIYTGKFFYTLEGLDELLEEHLRLRSEKNPNFIDRLKQMFVKT